MPPLSTVRPALQRTLLPSRSFFKLSPLDHRPPSHPIARTYSTPRDEKIAASEPPQKTGIKLGEHKTIILGGAALKPGYTKLQDRLAEIYSAMMLAAFVTPSLSGLWIWCTEEPLLASPVALAILLTGGGISTERAGQALRIKNYAKMSLRLNSSGPADSKHPDENEIALRLLASDAAKISFGVHQLKISGNIVDLNTVSIKQEKAAHEIQNLRRVVLPGNILTKQAETLVDHTFDRWITRLTVPFSILNIVAISLKQPKDRIPSDAVALASSIYNLTDFFSGDSVNKARAQLTAMLLLHKTPEAILQALIEPDCLHEDGGLSFLHAFIKESPSVGVRVGRTGSVILYKQPKESWGGPYPVLFFPPKPTATQEDKDRGIEPKHPGQP